MEPPDRNSIGMAELNQPEPGELGLESTAELLERIRLGDKSARERLVSRYLPILKRLAHGRLPARARDLSDTDDLVQVTILRALDHIETFEMRREGAFLAYMRRILVNQIRDEIRRVSRRPDRVELGDEVPGMGPSPLEEAIGTETAARYEDALGRLTDEQREAVILRLELGYTYQQIAEALGHGSSNAARMMVTRALVRLSKSMGSSGGTDGR
jgi:RNA polymerase sigma factor (sigma-70 family)